MLRRKKGKEKEEEDKPVPLAPPRRRREHDTAYIRRRYRYQKRLLRGKRFRIPWAFIVVGIIAFYVLHVVLHVG